MPNPTSGFFEAYDGLKLWSEGHASEGPARGAVLIVHGYAEHGGRYGALAQHLTAAGFAVMTYDYRGHGRAQGQRGHCDRFTDYLSDLERAATRLRAAVDRPLVLLAQSHGALVVLRALTEPNRWQLPGLTAAVVTSPFLGIKMAVPRWKLVLGKAASRLAPRLSMPNGIHAEDLSHDAAQTTAWTEDPLNHRQATARWFTEMAAAQNFVATHADRVTIPTLWLLAGDDRIVDAAAARRVYDETGGDKELHVYDGLFHELWNEIGKEKVLADLEGWLAKTCPKDG